MNEPSEVVRPVEDVYAWMEQEASIMLKAVTKFGDPVELSAGEVRTVAAALLELAERLERAEQHPEDGAL